MESKQSITAGALGEGFEDLLLSGLQGGGGMQFQVETACEGIRKFTGNRTSHQPKITVLQLKSKRFRIKTQVKYQPIESCSQLHRNVINTSLYLLPVAKICHHLLDS